MSTPPPEVPDPASDVPDNVLVYRLVPISACQIIAGNWEFTSSAFDNATPEHPDESPDDMSVVLGDTLAAYVRDPADLPNFNPWAGDEWGVAVLEAEFLRGDEGQELRRTPSDEEPAHGDVRGSKGSGRRKRLKKHAEWIVRPATPPD